MGGGIERGRKGISKVGREGGRGGREGGYYKGREGGRGGRKGGREKEVITKGEREEGRKGGYYKGSIDRWKDEDRDGRYYKGSGEAGRVLQTEGWRAGGREGGRISRMKELKPLYQLYIISMM